MNALLIIVGIIGAINLAGGVINAQNRDGLHHEHLQFALGGLILGAVGIVALF